jgi:hypothetical protein
MKLDYSNTPKTYTQMRVKTTLLAEQELRAEALRWILQMVLAFTALIIVAIGIG